MAETIEMADGKLDLYCEGDRLWFETNGATWFTMSPDEARRLAAALTQMADRIEGVVSGTASPINVEDAMDPDFTGGLEPTEYLDKLHSGQLKTTGQHHD